MNLEKWHLASSFPVKARGLPCSCGSHQFDFSGFSNCLLLLCLKVLNPENLSWENYLLVFTKSVNSNFHAFLLVPLTQNILGYSLFGTGINMASCFAIVFQWQMNQLHQQKPCKPQNLVCWCLLVGLENYFLIEFATKFIVKMYSIKLFP